MLRIVVVTASLLLQTSVDAAIICVTPPDGVSPSEACDRRTETLSEATALAGPGDEMILGRGTFLEPLRPRSGSAGRPLRIRGEGPAATIFSGADTLKDINFTGEMLIRYLPPCQGCGQIFFGGVEVPRLKWPLEPPSRFAKVFGHVASAKLIQNESDFSVVDVRVSEKLPDWPLVGGRAAVAQGEGYLLMPGRIVDYDLRGNSLKIHFQFPKEKKINVKAGNRIELFPIGKVSVETPTWAYWTADEGEQNAFIHLPDDARRQHSALQIKTRSVEVDLSDASHVVLSDIGVFAGAIRTGDKTEDDELRNFRVDYGLSRLPTELTSNGWYVEGDREGAIELRGQGHRFLNSTVEDSMGNGLLALGHNHLVSGNTILDSNRVGLELAAISFGPNIGSAGHMIENNILVRSGRHMIGHRGLRGGEIKGNLIERWGLLTSDTGGTYNHSGDCAGTLIDHNWFEGSDARYSVGIYLDALSRNCIVRNNVTIDVESGIWMGNSDIRHIIDGNFATGRRVGIGVYVPKGESLTLNGTVVGGNEVFPNFQPTEVGGFENRVLRDNNNSLRGDALEFAASHNFPLVARPLKPPLDD